MPTELKASSGVLKVGLLFTLVWVILNKFCVCLIFVVVFYWCSVNKFTMKPYPGYIGTTILFFSFFVYSK